MNAIRPHCWWVNNGSGTAWCQPMLTNISDEWTNVDQDLWCHMASLGHNELTQPEQSKTKHTYMCTLCIYCIDYTLTHWGRVTHICVSKLTIIGSDNGLSPGRHQAIIRTNAGILLIGTLGTNFSEILSEIHTFSFKKMHLKMSSGRWRPFCLGLNVLSVITSEYIIFLQCNII